MLVDLRHRKLHLLLFKVYTLNIRKSTGKGRNEPVLSDEDSLHDTASIISSEIDNRSVQEEGAELDERSQMEILEEKLKEVIDLTAQKSANGRVTSFESLCKAFSSKYMPDFVGGRRMTLMDCAERGLKKGRGAEQEAAAKLLALLCLQLGSIGDSETIYKDQKIYLLTLIADHSMAPGARAQVCLTMGLCTFLADCDLAEIAQVMLAFECIIFSAIAASASPDIYRLHSAALSAWSLLLTLMPPRHVYDLSQTHIRRLVHLLDSTDVDLRIGAGEAIALIYEGARQFDEDFGFDVASDDEEDGGGSNQVAASRQTEEMDELCDKLRQLATDSHKYRAKKDRKQQRSSFRDILRAVEACFSCHENEAPDIRVKFGKETLDIDTWGSKHQYDSFCQLLGSGMNLHLAQNELLRDIFNLGSALLDDGTGGSRVKKVERHHMNMAAFKARSLARGKNRDKRSAVF
uniref:EOG090X0ARF n=1 Tax=Alona affinis TaxID=381656 RepID=A0A9N6WWF0_9CRUS|nr:EOG090X0ARF [Alona affinis]